VLPEQHQQQPRQQVSSAKKSPVDRSACIISNFQNQKNNQGNNLHALICAMVRLIKRKIKEATCTLATT
jgi:hypothetical protein